MRAGGEGCGDWGDFRAGFLRKTGDDHIPSFFLSSSGIRTRVRERPCRRRIFATVDFEYPVRSAIFRMESPPSTQPERVVRSGCSRFTPPPQYGRSGPEAVFP